MRHDEMIVQYLIYWLFRTLRAGGATRIRKQSRIGIVSTLLWCL